jgi:hypothetical protein
MYTGRRKELWDHTSLLAAKIHNAFATDRSQRASQKDFHPYYQKERADPPMAANTGDLLISTFCRKDS